MATRLPGCTDSVLKTGLPLAVASLKLEALKLLAATGLLKVTVTGVLTATLFAPSVGVTEVTESVTAASAMLLAATASGAESVAAAWPVASVLSAAASRLFAPTCPSSR